MTEAARRAPGLGLAPLAAGLLAAAALGTGPARADAAERALTLLERCRATEGGAPFDGTGLFRTGPGRWLDLETPLQVEAEPGLCVLYDAQGRLGEAGTARMAEAAIGWAEGVVSDPETTDISPGTTAEIWTNVVTVGAGAENLGFSAEKRPRLGLRLVLSWPIEEEAE